MTKYITILLTALAVVLSGCGSADSDPVERASAAVEAGDDQRAQHDIDHLLADTVSFDALTVSQLCRLALVCVTIDGNQEANDGAAVRCLNRARSLDSDSVDMFLSKIAIEPEGGHLYTLDRVGAYLEIPREELVAAEDMTEPEHNDSTDTETLSTDQQ